MQANISGLGNEKEHSGPNPACFLTWLILLQFSNAFQVVFSQYPH